MKDKTYKNKVRSIMLTLAVFPIVIASLFFLYYKINSIYSNTNRAIEQCTNGAIEQINGYAGTALQRMRFITYYSKINNCLMCEKKMPVDSETLKTNDEINSVLGAMFSDNNMSDVSIFTTNPNAVEISSVRIVNDNFFEDKNLIVDKAVWRVEEEDLRTYLSVYKKYSLIPQYCNVIRIRIPFEQIVRGITENEYQRVYASITTDSVTEKEFGYENGKLFSQNGTDSRELYKRSFRIDSIQSNLDVAIEKSNIRKEIAIICVIYVVAIAAILLLAAFLTKVSTDNITRELTEIISEIDKKNIDKINSKNIKNKEFVVIQKCLTELIYNLKVENKERVELQLQVLNQRITPHFLYNNLSAIKSKCGDKETRVAVDRLIKYCRSVFSTQSNFITVEQEIRNSCIYLELLQFCYDFKFEIYTEIDEDTKQIKIPINILQPICENAFMHGINRMPDGFNGIIKITTQKEDNYLVIDVADNAGQLKNTRISEERKRAHALDILRKLIDIQYNDNNCGIELSGDENETHTTVRISSEYEV